MAGIKRTSRLKLTKCGVYLSDGGGTKKLIAAPIRFYAIGKLTNGKRAVEIRFVDCDGQKLSEFFGMAAINPRNLATIADALGNKGYLWPTGGVSALEILNVVVAKRTSRRFAFVG